MSLLRFLAFLLLIVGAHAVSASPLDDQLFEVAKSGDSAAIERLVADGADINSKDKAMMTPLMIAINWNQTEAVKTILQLGGDQKYLRAGESCLFLAVGRDTEIVKVLIAVGADVNQARRDGETPLTHAAGLHDGIFNHLRKIGSYQGISPNVLETVIILLSAGANVNHIASGRRSSLRMAMMVNNKEVAKLLLRAGADVHQRIPPEFQQDTIIMQTVSYYSVHHDLEAIELLLNYGANPDDRNEQPYDEYCEWKGACQWTGYSVLTYAAKEGWTEVVKLLLQKGANPSLPRTDGKSASELARAKGHIHTASVIEKYLEKRVVP